MAAFILLAMELSFAFLALHADYTDDKSLWVAGADFDRMAVLGVPPVAQFSLVVKFRVPPEDANIPHVMRIDVTGPNGERKPLNSNEPIPTKKNEQYPDRNTSAVAILRVGMAFNNPGEYSFHIVLDEKDIKSIPLLIELPQTPK